MEGLDERFESFKEQCDAGSVEACHSLAEYYQLVGNDAEKARLLFEENCDTQPGKRFAPSCFSLATMLVNGGGDGQRAVDYFDKACAGGFSEGCYNMGVIYSKGLLGELVNAAKADQYYERACSTGIAKACVSLGVSSMSVNHARALHYYEKGCLLGDLYGCVNATVMLSKGETGVPRDLERADAMRKMAETIAKQLGVTVKQ